MQLDASEDDKHIDEAEVLKRQAVEGMGDVMSAAKTQQLITILSATEYGVKSLVFSQVRHWSLFCGTLLINEYSEISGRLIYIELVLHSKKRVLYAARELSPSIQQMRPS